MGRSFVPLFFSFEDTLSQLNKDEQNDLIWAMLRYGKYGEEPTFSNRILGVAWTCIKPVLDSSEASRQKKSHENAGAPIGNQNAVKNNREQSKTIGNNQNNMEKDMDMEKKTRFFRMDDLV